MLGGAVRTGRTRQADLIDARLGQDDGLGSRQRRLDPSIARGRNVRARNQGHLESQGRMGGAVELVSQRQKATGSNVSAVGAVPPEIGAGDINLPWVVFAAALAVAPLRRASSIVFAFQLRAISIHTPWL